MDRFKIPNKKYFKDKEVAKTVNVSPRVIYFWESKLPLFAPIINSQNEKLYSREELLMFLEIKELIMDKNKSFDEVYKILKKEKSMKNKRENQTEKSDIIQEIKDEIKDILTILKK